ncbi:hypothetical protein ACE1SV_60700 [Streptomyces sennicomposti]
MGEGPAGCGRAAGWVVGLVGEAQEFFDPLDFGRAAAVDGGVPDVGGLVITCW